MDDTTQTTTGALVGTTLISFAIGAAIGAGLALLLAPDSGERTRARLARGARQLGELTVDTLDQARTASTDSIAQARSAATNLGDDVVAAVAAGRDSFSKDRASR